MERSVYQICLDEGPATIQLPARMSPVSAEDLSYFLVGMMRTVRRIAAKSPVSALMAEWAAADNGW